ncbi:hypothetical protein WMY93_012760 [Mugilogobius chulae]|uniref:Uncharacterized protein n=1 Tax=Mugilogobius chulae TaxID=88201 RepID=A0AAW0P9M3_9GOBI
MSVLYSSLISHVPGWQEGHDTSTGPEGEETVHWRSCSDSCPQQEALYSCVSKHVSRSCFLSSGDVLKRSPACEGRASAACCSWDPERRHERGRHGHAGRRQRFENSEFTVRIYPGALAEGTIYCPISARKTTTAAEAIERVIDRLQLDRTKCYVLAEVKEFGGEEWILNPCDCPVQRMMLWPRVALEHRPLSGGEDYRFLLRLKNLDGSIHYGGSLQMWLQVTEERRRMVERGLLPQPDSQGDYADLCCLPELNERSLLDNLRSRFRQEKIYTYVGSILIVINPFKFLPIYNPKYVKMYDNHTLGALEPHIYAVADVAYHAMLQRQRNQCIVISGESGSGKTQSTNFLIHHLTALSQKGYASGVEQIILGAGPVLEFNVPAHSLSFGSVCSLKTITSLMTVPHLLIFHRIYQPKESGKSSSKRSGVGPLQVSHVLSVLVSSFSKHTPEECHSPERPGLMCKRGLILNAHTTHTHIRAGPVEEGAVFLIVCSGRLRISSMKIDAKCVELLLLREERRASMTSSWSQWTVTPVANGAEPL